MELQQVRITEFDYELPDERIAWYPSAQRESSRLLHYADGAINITSFSELPNLIPPPSLIVFNETKVIPARIEFVKPSGGRIEVFCLEPGGENTSFQRALEKTKEVQWYCLIGGASKWKAGTLLQKKLLSKEHTITLSVSHVKKEEDRFLLTFSWTPDHLPFSMILEAVGDTPLPPYIKRKTEEKDRERYQTVFAKNEGSVAAPTAGLHFTTDILHQLNEQGVETGFLTLHVGAGTFRPVQSERIGEHTMHSETIQCSVELLYQLLRHLPDSVVAVGTTALRSLETLYWLGVKASTSALTPGSTPHIAQWEPYQQKNQKIHPAESITALIKWMEEASIPVLEATTQLLIGPGYSFQIADKLITNFHQPRSTLLLLIAAFIGEDWRKVYDSALKNEFRFLSYGDSSLLERNTVRQVENQE